MDFDRKQKMRLRTGQENFRYSQQHSLDSMASSSSNFLPSDPFYQTPPRVQLRPSEPETKVKTKFVECFKKLRLGFAKITSSSWFRTSQQSGRL